MELKLVMFALALLLLHAAVASPVAPTLGGTQEGSGWAHTPYSLYLQFIVFEGIGGEA